jgi:hypothetical protein
LSFAGSTRGIHGVLLFMTKEKFDRL